MDSLVFTPAGCFRGVLLVPIRRGMGLGVPLDAITPAVQVGDPIIEYRRRRRNARWFWFARVGRIEEGLAHLVSIIGLSVTLPYTSWRRTLNAAPTDVVPWLVYADWLAEHRHPRQERAVRLVAEFLDGHLTTAATDLVAGSDPTLTASPIGHTMRG